MLPIYVAAPHFNMPDAPPPTPASEVGDLLRQTIDLQREQIGYLRGLLASQDQSPKWKAFLARWQDEFPDVGHHCKSVLPAVERAYLALLDTGHLRVELYNAHKNVRGLTVARRMDELKGATS